MDENNLNPVDDGDQNNEENKPDLPDVPGVYPGQHKYTAEDIAEKEAAAEREQLKAQWEAQQVVNKQEERRKAEEARQKAEREALYKDLENLDYDLLSLSEYPSDFEVESARRARMGWFFGLGVAVFLFTSSLLNLVHSWVGGIAGGVAFVLWLSHGTGMLTILPGLSKYPELLAKRRRIKNQVTEYIQKTESKRGYIHRVYPLVHHNPRLRARKFRRIALMSKEHTIMSHMKTLQDVALYHEYLEEAKKAAQEYFLKEAEDKLLEEHGLSDDDVENLEKDLDEGKDADEDKKEKASEVTQENKSPDSQDERPLQAAQDSKLNQTPPTEQS